MDRQDENLKIVAQAHEGYIVNIVLARTKSRAIDNFRRTYFRSIGPAAGIAILLAVLVSDRPGTLANFTDVETLQSFAESDLAKDTVDKPTRDIEGIVVDVAGFPVSNAYVNLPEKNIWEGV